MKCCYCNNTQTLGNIHLYSYFYEFTCCDTDQKYDHNDNIELIIINYDLYQIQISFIEKFTSLICLKNGFKRLITVNYCMSYLDGADKIFNKLIKIKNIS